MAKERRLDIRQDITDQMVAAIKRGAGEFLLPWHCARRQLKPMRARKAASGGSPSLTLIATGGAPGSGEK